MKAGNYSQIIIIIGKNTYFQHSPFSFLNFL